jgi:predicted short-subunit dehydrogenase-like oxidoreductase (DUF2520 family)
MRGSTLGVIGAGRVGAVLAAALSSTHEVVACSGRSDASSTRIETLLPGVRRTDPVGVARSADIVLIAVPDDALAGVVATIVAAGAVRSGQLVVHTSGRHGTDVLEPARAAGAGVVALHPAMTFTGTHVDLDRLAGCTMALTTDPGSCEIGRRLVAALGGRATWVADEQRATYHAAMAHGANHLTTVVTQAMDLLRQAGAEDPSGTLRPLLTAALDNALAYGDAALTGPVVRGDVTTVQAHLVALAAAPASTADSYLAMARATADRAVADGRLDRERARAITDELDTAVWEATAAALAPPAGR